MHILTSALVAKCSDLIGYLHWKNWDWFEKNL